MVTTVSMKAFFPKTMISIRAHWTQHRHHQGSQDFGLPFIRIRTISVHCSISARRYQCRARALIPTGTLSTTFRGNSTEHDLKFGYEFRRTFVNAFFDAGYRGRLDFDSLEDFLSGTLSGGRSARGDSRRDTFQNSHAIYPGHVSLEPATDIQPRAPLGLFRRHWRKAQLLQQLRSGAGARASRHQTDSTICTIATGTIFHRVWVLPGM